MMKFQMKKEEPLPDDKRIQTKDVKEGRKRIFN